MKLSKMTLDHVAAVLTTAAIELEPILADKKIMSLSSEIVQGEDESMLDYGIRVAQTMLGTISLFSDKYLHGIYRILAAFFQCTPEEVGAKPMDEVWAQIMDSFNDEVFLSFFPSLRSSGVPTSSDISQSQEPSAPLKRSFTFWKNIGKKKRKS